MFKKADCLSPKTTPLNKSNKTFQYIASLSACLGPLASGAVLGWTANISEDLKLLTYNGIKIQDNELGWIGSLAVLGATVSSIPMAFLCNLIGRKIAMLLLIFPFMTGWLLIIFAERLWMIYLGRFLTGFAGLAFRIAVPMYIGEIADKDIRGRLASLLTLSVSTGILLSYSLALFMDIMTYTITLATIPLIFALTFVFQPESPLYSIKKNKDDEAKKALLNLRGKSFDIETEFERMKLNVMKERKNNNSFIYILFKKSTTKSCLIVFCLMILQHLSGVNVIIFYTETIFSSTGVHINPKILTVIIGCLQSISMLMATVLVDKLGRKILLIGSSVGASIALGCLGVYFTLYNRNFLDASQIESIAILPVISISAFITIYCVGVGPIPWVLLSELFPPEIKNVGAGFAGALNAFSSFLVTRFYFNVASAVGADATFYFFASVNLFLAIFVYFVVPETKNKTLEEIQLEMGV